MSIEVKDAPRGAVAFKYGDPTEGPKWVFEVDEAKEIAREDPALIVWVEGYEQE